MVSMATRLKSKVWRTNSERQTIDRARAIGEKLEAGIRVALVGKLGSGKTTFVKGLALGLGVRRAKEVRSPTFVIFHIYKGRIPIYHFDLYRLESASDLDGVGIDEFLSDEKAVSVVEWADRIPKIVEDSDIRIEMSRAGEKKRIIRMHVCER